MPPRVASYRRQPRAIKSTTPMGLPYHCPFITTTTTGMVRIMAFIITPQRGVCPCNNIELCTAWPFITATWHRDCAHHVHLSSRHNMECDHTTTLDCVPHGHLSPHHNVGCGHTTTWDCAPHRNLSPNYGIDVSRNMGIYHYTTTRGMVMPSCGVARRMAIHRQTTP